MSCWPSTRWNNEQTCSTNCSKAGKTSHSLTTPTRTSRNLTKGRWTRASVDLHLHAAGTPIGIYPLEGGNRCRWICSDFDTSEAEELAWRYAEAWEYYGIQAWVETSRSKGYHVWVFADDWMSGTIARRAGLWVHELAGDRGDRTQPEARTPRGQEGTGTASASPTRTSQADSGKQSLKYQRADGSRKRIPVLRRRRHG